MSHEAVAYVKRLYVRSAPQKLILFMLADRISNETGKCFPGIALIASETSISRSQVHVHLEALRLAGVLLSDQRRRDGRQSSNEYEIVGFLDWLQQVNLVGLGAAVPATNKANALEKKAKEARRVAESGNPDSALFQSPGFQDTESGFPDSHRVRVSGHESKERITQREEDRPNLPKTAIPAPSSSSTKQVEGAKGKEGQEGRKAGPRAPRLELPLTDAHREAEQGAKDELAADRVDFDAYCAAAREVGLDVPQHLTPGRRQSIRSVREAFGAHAWAKAVDNLRLSPFCAGRNNRGWRINFDSFAKQEFFVKMLEGQFVDSEATKKVVVDISKARAFTPDQWRFRLEKWVGRGRTAWPEGYGPAPGEPGSLVPADILAEFPAEVAGETTRIG